MQPVDAPRLDRFRHSLDRCAGNPSFLDRFYARFLLTDEEVDRLREVEGIGEKKLAALRESWNAQRGVQNVMLFLREHDISTSWAVRIYHRYGVDAVSIMQEDPYRLVDDVDGIGFKVADGIARSLGTSLVVGLILWAPLPKRASTSSIRRSAAASPARMTAP